MKTLLQRTMITLLIMVGFLTQTFAQQQAFMVGSATEGGWDLGAQTEMTVSETDTNVFVYSDTLTAGEFKIKLYVENDFCAGMWMHPIEAGQSIDKTEAAILEGCANDNPDFKWEITEPGLYTLTANLSDTTLSIVLDQSINVSYDALYMVGSATPGGWDLASQTTLSKSEDNEDVFTWSGTLIAGEIKIKTYQEQDFCAGKWIHPTVENASIEQNDFELLFGCSDSNPDYKWVVSESDTGMYSITVDMSNETINFEKQNSTSTEELESVDSFTLLQNYPNPFNPSTIISYQVSEISPISLAVYDANGRMVSELVNKVQTPGTYSITFEAGNLASGIYFYQLKSAQQQQMKQMILIK